MRFEAIYVLRGLFPYFHPPTIISKTIEEYMCMQQLASLLQLQLVEIKGLPQGKKRKDIFRNAERRHLTYLLSVNIHIWTTSAWVGSSGPKTLWEYIFSLRLSSILWLQQPQNIWSSISSHGQMVCSLFRNPQATYSFCCWFSSFKRGKNIGSECLWTYVSNWATRWFAK